MPLNHVKSLQDQTGVWCADSGVEKINPSDCYLVLVALNR